mgnify:CR=1 FL=1
MKSIEDGPAPVAQAAPLPQPARRGAKQAARTPAASNAAKGAAANSTAAKGAAPKPAAAQAAAAPKRRSAKADATRTVARAAPSLTDNDEHPQYIGRNLRHARLVAGLTLRDLADQVGCSESLLSKIENERAVPSLQMLHRIVKHLDTSIGFLFANPASQSRIVMRQGERPEIKTSHPRRGGQDVGVSIEWLVPYPEGKLLSGSIHKIAPGGGSQGAITHKGEEVGYVLKGRFELNVANELHLLNAGDSFFFPSELLHSYRNPGSVETWVLWINTPPTF